LLLRTRSAESLLPDGSKSDIPSLMNTLRDTCCKYGKYIDKAWSHQGWLNRDQYGRGSSARMVSFIRGEGCHRSAPAFFMNETPIVKCRSVLPRSINLVVRRRTTERRFYDRWGFGGQQQDRCQVLDGCSAVPCRVHIHLEQRR
jgi:hypothetical protein